MGPILFAKSGRTPFGDQESVQPIAVRLGPRAPLMRFERSLGQSGSAPHEG
jgi:hypothetical protein